MSGTVLLTAEHLRSIVGRVGVDRLMDQTVSRLRHVLAEYSRSAYDTPTRSGFSYHSPTEGLVEWMPTWDGKGRVTIKVVGYHPRNPVSNGLPTIVSNVQVYNTESGHLEAIADGAFITALRTGAVSGVVTDLLGAPEASTVGMIGLGAQAVSQLHAMTRVRRLDTVLIHDSDQRQIDSFRERVAPIAPSSIAIETAPVETMVATSDILCTSTSIGVGSGPLFTDQHVRPWLHVNAVGSDYPGKFELPLELLRRSRVIADFLPQARREGESQRLENSEIAGTLPDIVQDIDWASSLRGEITVFDSTGWALTDHVTMALLLQHARVFGQYTTVDLEMGERGPHSPYDWVGVKSTLPDRPPLESQPMTDTG